MIRLRMFGRCLVAHLRILKRYLYDPGRLLVQFPDTQFEAGATASRDCHFAEGVRIHAHCVLDQTTVGRYSFVAAGSHLRHCRVGAFCSIGPWVGAGLGRHPSRNYVSTHPAFFSTAGQAQKFFVTESRFDEFAPVNIGNDVWIGAGVLIADGVTIGDGAIVGGGAVVAKDIAPYTVAGGVPAEPIRTRFSTEEIAFLEQLQWWNRDETWLRQHADLFSDIQRFRQALA